MWSFWVRYLGSGIVHEQERFYVPTLNSLTQRAKELKKKNRDIAQVWLVEGLTWDNRRTEMI